MLAFPDVDTWSFCHAKRLLIIPSACLKKINLDFPLRASYTASLVSELALGLSNRPFHITFHHDTKGGIPADFCMLESFSLIFRVSVRLVNRDITTMEFAYCY
jgi:hypothetical protein